MKKISVDYDFAKIVWEAAQGIRWDPDHFFEWIDTIYPNPVSFIQINLG